MIYNRFTIFFTEKNFMKKHLSSYIIKITAMTVFSALLLTSCTAGTDVKTFKPDSINTHEAQYSGAEFHKAAADNYKTICSSGLIELLFDEKTMTPAIRDTSGNTVWYALSTDGTDSQLTGSAVEVTLSNGGDLYVLNSQDNAVSMGNASYSASGNSVTVNYSMAPDEQTGKADISSLTEKQIRVDLSVIYTLTDGSFYVNISMNKLSLPKGVYLEKISVLNSFGAYSKSGENDYIFVPDGSGALIMTGIEDEEFKPLSLDVYGQDAAKTDSRESSSCLVGAYGIKKGDCAFVCIVERGDSIAQINAYRNSDNSLNSVYASFETTDIYTSADKKIKRTYGYEYANEIKLCYRFLSGKSATYSGMATACRENLIRNSVLSTKTVETEEENIPLVTAVQGGYIKGSKYSVLSDFEQTQTLMRLLKAKGVNNVYLRYNGLHKNANNGTDGGFSDFKSGLGSRKQWEALYSYLSSQKFRLFIDTDILTFKRDASESAKSVTGKSISTVKDENAAFALPTGRQSFLKLSLIEDRIEDILAGSAEINFDGYSVNDIASYLYSDYSPDFYTREAAKIEIAAQMPVLAASKLLMVDRGNIYCVKNADIISEIPTSPVSAAESDAYRGIPFVQLIVHGTTEYSAKGMNTYEDMKLAFLKSVEYGCLPSVEWYCTAFDPSLDEKYYFDKNINDAVSFYLKANEALADLRDARMTQHYEVQDGVFCAEYSSGNKIYVNYTDKAVTVSGITVNALDCQRV